MNVKEFFYLSHEQRELLVECHRQQKLVRMTRDTIATERKRMDTLEYNNQINCLHPFAEKTYKAFENEYGNLTGNGEYRYHCEDCNKRWTTPK